MTINGLKIATPYFEQGASMQKKQMDEQFVQRNGVLHFPSILNTEPERVGKTGRSWLFRRLVDLGVIDMAGSQNKGWNINPTTITTLIAILLFFGGICTWLWNQAYQKGVDDMEKKIILERLSKAEDDLRRTKALQEYTSGAQTAHKPEDDKNKKKQ